MDILLLEKQKELNRVAFEYSKVAYEEDASISGTNYILDDRRQDFFDFYFNLQRIHDKSPKLLPRHFNTLECLNLYTEKVNILFFESHVKKPCDSIIAQFLVFLYIQYKGRITLNYTRTFHDAIRKTFIKYDIPPLDQCHNSLSKYAHNIKKEVQEGYIREVLGKWSTTQIRMQDIGDLWGNHVHGRKRMVKDTDDFPIEDIIQRFTVYRNHNQDNSILNSSSLTSSTSSQLTDKIFKDLFEIKTPPLIQDNGSSTQNNISKKRVREEDSEPLLDSKMLSELGIQIVASSNNENDIPLEELPLDELLMFWSEENPSEQRQEVIDCLKTYIITQCKTNKEVVNELKSIIEVILTERRK